MLCVGWCLRQKSAEGGNEQKKKPLCTSVVKHKAQKESLHTKKKNPAKSKKSNIVQLLILQRCQQTIEWFVMHDVMSGKEKQAREEQRKEQGEEETDTRRHTGHADTLTDTDRH